MTYITQSQVTGLQAALAERHPHLQLTDSQLEMLFTMPPQAADFECWIKAIMYLIQTGDIMGAVMKMIQCLLTSGLRTQADIFGCLFNFVMGLFQGVPINEALTQLIRCVFGTPPPPPPPPPGQIPPYEGREVNRCG